MKKALVAAAVLIAVQAPAQAQYVSTGSWIAAGILTTQNRDLGYFKTEYVQLGNFETEERCKDVVKVFSQSDDFIGTGGTNGKVDSIQWNYDARCVMVNPF